MAKAAATKTSSAIKDINIETVISEANTAISAAKAAKEQAEKAAALDVSIAIDAQQAANEAMKFAGIASANKTIAEELRASIEQVHAHTMKLTEKSGEINRLKKNINEQNEKQIKELIATQLKEGRFAEKSANDGINSIQKIIHEKITMSTDANKNNVVKKQAISKITIKMRQKLAIQSSILNLQDTNKK